MKQRRFEAWVLVAFLVSGIAGLIYQSIWSQYFGLILGHAAYAQTLVLAIFMGGMSLGAWWVSRRSQSIRRFLYAYAVVELLIGIGGLLFHTVFVRYQGLTYDTILPSLQSGWSVDGYLWLSSALMMAPQSILLGMTFPLMSSAVMQHTDSEDERVLGGLYFANSVGAGLGALLATFAIMPKLGLPGTLTVGAVLNIVAALIAWLLLKVEAAKAGEGEDENAMQARHAPASEERSGGALPLVLLAAAWITGATSFVYEIGWVRSLNQTLGASIHSFELMLSAFIFGLAFGGLWIRHRAGRIGDPIRYAAGAQILMGAFALLSLPAFASSFRWMEWIMGGLARTDTGYTLFTLGSSAISFAVMFPAAFFAGMTLPLFTTALLRAGYGERSIGRVYAVNTLGAIVGVFLCTHFLIPVFSVYAAIFASAALDIALGFFLLRYAAPAQGMRWTPAFAVIAVATMTAAVVWGRPDLREQISGVYRTGSLAWTETESVEYFEDGKTATVGIRKFGDHERTIVTNGKPDAALTNDIAARPTSDEPTMALAAVLPVTLAKSPDDIAVIGWGSGLTTHTILGSPAPKRVETIEIEPAMYEAAKRFGDRVERAYSDPRSVPVFEDARSHFARVGKRYDAIVSEPSNPWVSGTASLFTQEFYRMLSRHLKDDGVLVQWIHIYEIDDKVFATMPAALSRVFPYVQVYVVNSGDLLMVASRSPIREPDFSRFPQAMVDRELKRLDVHDANAVRMRLVADKPFLNAFLWAQDTVPHSDFYPFVMLNAPRTRFKKETALGLIAYLGAGVPLVDRLVLKRPVDFEGELTEAGGNPRVAGFMTARHLLSLLRDEDPSAAEGLLGQYDLSGPLALKRFAGKPVGAQDRAKWQRSMLQVGGTLASNASQAQILSLLESDAIKPDLTASDPTVAAVYAMYRTTVEDDSAKILAIPFGAFSSPEYDVVVGDYLLAAQMLAAIESGNAAAFQNALNISSRRTGDPSMRQVRLLLHLYGLQHFQGIKVDGMR